MKKQKKFEFRFICRRPIIGFIRHKRESHWFVCKEKFIDYNVPVRIIEETDFQRLLKAAEGR